ncbi:MAG TPA: hypothetical protein VNK95_05220 [Caldilineaceae bacterium]|nr:hypothetical protein [Caldilineaceae bacterium]
MSAISFLAPNLERQLHRARGIRYRDRLSTVKFGAAGWLTWNKGKTCLFLSPVLMFFASLWLAFFAVSPLFWDDAAIRFITAK